MTAARPDRRRADDAGSIRIAGSLAMGGQRRDRRVRRVATDIAAGFRERGRSRLDIEVVNLSTHGCRVEFAGALVVGERAWLTLPTIDSWAARVAWLDGGEAGLDFIEPLDRASVAAAAGG